LRRDLGCKFRQNSSTSKSKEVQTLSERVTPEQIGRSVERSPCALRCARSSARWGRGLARACRGDRRRQRLARVASGIRTSLTRSRWPGGFLGRPYAPKRAFPLPRDCVLPALPLLPAADDELRRAADLIDRALAADPKTYGWARPYFLFARGLVEYRRDRFDAAAATLSGPARAPGAGRRLAPGLVLAMARHRRGDREGARQALAWLKADLTAWDKLAEGPAEQRMRVRQPLTWWRADPDLIGVRYKDALDKLPEEERAKWQELWGEVDGLLQRVGDQK
jgi:hypothetical protein